MNDTHNPDAVISIMLVDDSSIVKRMLQGFLEEDKYIKVIDTAANGREALSKLDCIKPDIVILDIEMPEMDGITALPQIIKKAPGTKVVMCSSLTEKGAEISMRAFSLGAVECIPKPTTSGTSENRFSKFQADIMNTVKALYPDKRRMALPLVQMEERKRLSENETAQMLRGQITKTQPDATSFPKPEKALLREPVSSTHKEDKEKITLYDDSASYRGKPDILAIGSSTGGPQALFEVLKNLGHIDVPVVITQHMPPTFTKLLAEHITQNTGIPTHEGQNGMALERGHIYIAPGGFHMLFKRGAQSRVEIILDDGPQVNFCKPAVDPMFESLIKIYGQKILAAILTGMGHDGLEGSRMLVQAKGRVIAQDEQTSTVWGMPRAVAHAGICSKVLPLKEIGPWLRSQVNG